MIPDEKDLIRQIGNLAMGALDDYDPAANPETELARVNVVMVKIVDLIDFYDPELIQ